MDYEEILNQLTEDEIETLAEMLMEKEAGKGNVFGRMGASIKKAWDAPTKANKVLGKAQTSAAAHSGMHEATGKGAARAANSEARVTKLTKTRNKAVAVKGAMVGGAALAGGAALSAESNSGHRNKGKQEERGRMQARGEKNAEAILPFITEEEFGILVDNYEQENQKEASSYDEVLSTLTEQDIVTLLDRVDQYEKEAEYIDKIAEHVNPLISELSDEIYNEMKKDAGFGRALRSGVDHVARNKVAYGVGAAAGIGLLDAGIQRKNMRNTQNNLAHMMAAETAADIATDQIFDSRDRKTMTMLTSGRNEMNRNRSAIMYLANVMKKNGIVPEKVKSASMPLSLEKQAGKVGDALRAAKEFVKGVRPQNPLNLKKDMKAAKGWKDALKNRPQYHKNLNPLVKDANTVLKGHAATIGGGVLAAGATGAAISALSD